MALDLKFRIKLSTDGETLTIIDRTGVYSGLNTGGFGSPNAAVSDATSATIKIALRNSDGTFGTETTVNAYSTLPSNSAGEFDITATTGIGAATYSDGIYRLIYTVAGTSGGTPFSTSVTRYDVLRNSIAICYQKKATEYSASECLTEAMKKSFNEFSTYMRLLCREEGGCAEGAGNLNQIQKYLTKLTSLCADDCGCC